MDHRPQGTGEVWDDAWEDGREDRADGWVDAWGNALPGELRAGHPEPYAAAGDAGAPRGDAEGPDVGSAGAAWRRTPRRAGEPAVPVDERPSAHRADGRRGVSRRALLVGAGVGALAVAGFAAWGVAALVGRGDGADGGAAGDGSDAAVDGGADGAPAEPAVHLGTATLHEQDGARLLVYDEGRITESGAGRMTFSAVGDNLVNDNLLALADAWAGAPGDGAYDFAPFYAAVAPTVQDGYDVSFINQETVLGGTEAFDYMGYPSYNTPDAVADAVAAAGWRVVNLATNHTYDIWTDGIEHALRVWGSHEGILTCGSYASEEDRQTVRAVECNGVRVAVLSYCYGQNGYELSDLPNDYYAVPLDEAALRADVARARGAADAVLVYMHWGEEYVYDPTDEQRYYAQVCADIGVDAVIGSHCHVIQPVEWVARSDGGRMLCAYGLGDFLSGYRDNPKTVLSGMPSFDFVRVPPEEAAARDDVGPGGIAVENPVWHPLVEHMEGGTDAVRFVRDYTDDEAARNELLSTLDAPRQWLVDTTLAVVGDAVTVDV